ncbi:hypothetical protein [Streptomyces palmae]|uniref:Secreted protein n=1 Tax=Streptomyces palmae TaxID=1701085 RepID=A0A4Z0H746_9ACTN|nr:hypothetical protein [Streptomyces palmae]TGB05894.1 hypothetical protein E4099_18805 [Streptomyces palmae]
MRKIKARWLWSGALGGALLCAPALLGLPDSSGAEAAVPARSPRVVSGPVSGLNAASVAKCPRGTRVLNGGYVSRGFRTTNGSLNDYVLRNAPLPNGSGWQAKQLAGRVQAYAVCTAR